MVGRRNRCGWVTAAGLTLVFLLLHTNASLRRHNPLLCFPIRYASWSKSVENLRRLRSQLSDIASDPRLASVRRADQQPRTVVFVLGESVTRRNFSFAGYPRKTTPELDAMGDDLIWFSDVVSSDATTIPSLTKILTPATLGQPDLWRSKPDLILMARKAGYKTFWISNHGTDLHGEASLFVERADKGVLTNRGDSRGEGLHDDVVLPVLEEALRDPSPHKFILVHMLNTHPAYYFRYPKPFARFNDVDDAVVRELKAAGRAFWAVNNRNYYDNAILYMDTILKRSIELCRATCQPIVWLYVPDHGEDVAHYSNFSGHNARVLSQYEVPMMFWRSPSFPAPTVEVAELRRRPYQMDYLDHTLLGLMGIVGDYYEPERDIFSPAFKPWQRTICGKPYAGPNSAELNLE
jgi:heptose-I-phosphate ethanolaminephosphotransferase